MPNTREKLIEALRAIARENCFGSIEKIADHLIANGVTIPVRCKDCKHMSEYRGETLCDNPMGIFGRNTADDFCSHGERRNDENT